MRLYPRAFRDEYGPDLMQHFRDIVADRGVRPAWTRTVIDLLVTVPRYRLETLMPAHRSASALRATIVLLAVAGVVSILTGLLPGAILLVVAVVLATSQRTALARAIRAPRAEGRRRRPSWVAILAGGASALAVAIAIPQIDGGELSETWWLVMAAFGLAGIGMLVAGTLAAFTSRSVA